MSPYIPITDKANNPLKKKKGLAPGALASVSQIITHRNCPDGLASAIILHDAYPAIPIIFHYPGSRDLTAETIVPNTLFCDISPTKETAEAWKDAKAIVLDHHASARSLVESFGDLGIFADEKIDIGYCGAYLAYEEVWLPLRQMFFRDIPLETRLKNFHNVKEFARLAGIRDTRVNQSPYWDEACIQAEAMKFYAVDTWLDGPAISSEEWPDFYKSRLAIGQILKEKGDRRSEKTKTTAYRFTIQNGPTVGIVPTVRTSDLLDVKSDGLDIVIGFMYICDNPQRPTLRLSCRSRPPYTILNFCQSHGGGGHTQAAGCELPADVSAQYSPFVLIEALFTAFAQEQPDLLK